MNDDQKRQLEAQERIYRQRERLLAILMVVLNLVVVAYSLWPRD